MGGPPFSKPEDQILVEMFDSFMKVLLKNASRNLRKKYYRRMEIECPVEEPADYDYENNGVAPEMNIVSTNAIEVQGYVCEVSSDAIYRALHCLPENLLLVVVLIYWHDWAIANIAAHCDVTGRTICNRRDKAIRLLRRHLQGGMNDGTSGCGNHPESKGGMPIRS